MKGALAIASAEVRQHRIVIWTALLLGVLPLVLHYLVHGKPLRPYQPGEMRTNEEAFVWVFAIVLSLAVALGLGAGTVSRDLGERRLGFWLSRPLPLAQYWAAKLGAAYLLAVVAAVLVMSPAHLLGSLSWTDTSVSLTKALGWRGWLTGLAFTVAAASAAGGAVRARSGLLILDIVMLPLTWAAAWFAMGSTWQAGTGQVVLLSGMPWLVSAAILVLLAAGAAQICAGRLDVRRGHALLSTITWCGLWLFFVGGILLASRYVSSATPADLRLPHVSLHAPREGTHVILEGLSTRWRHHYVPGFLLDEAGESTKLGGLEGLSGWAWSTDGRHLAWSKEAFFGPAQARGADPPIGRGGGFEASILVLNVGEPGAVPRRLLPKDWSSVTALSPSGRRVLVRTAFEREVLDTSSGRSIARVGERAGWSDAAFLSEATVRALRVGSGSATVVDWDLATGRVTERGTLEWHGVNRTWYTNWIRPLAPNTDWDRVIRFDESGLFLHDLEGRLVATYVNGWPGRSNRIVGPLSNGRYGCIEEEPEGLRLRIFEGQGRLSMESRLKGRFPIRVGGESAPDLLALSVAQFSEGRATLFVDLATGRVTRREPGLAPAIRRWDSGRDGDTQNPEPGSFSTRLFVSDEGQIVTLDPGSGARRALVTRRDRIED